MCDSTVSSSEKSFDLEDLDMLHLWGQPTGRSHSSEDIDTLKNLNEKGEKKKCKTYKGTEESNAVTALHHDHHIHPFPTFRE